MGRGQTRRAAQPIPEPARVCGIVVNFRTPDLTLGAIASLAAAREAGEADITAVVVENGSGDGSLEALRAGIEAGGYSGWVTLLEAGANRGFAAGNNVALKHVLESGAGVDAFWLLNPDAVARPGAVKALVDELRAHPEAGLVGSAHVDGKGRPASSAFRFPGCFSELDRGLRFGPVTRLLRQHVVPLPHDSVGGEVDWLSGASLMVRSEVVKEVGVMDAGFFLYFEETDYCHRAQRAGWACRFAPDSVVEHLEGASIPPSNSASGRAPRIPGYRFDSRRRYFLKHRGRLVTFVADACWLAGHLLYRLRRVVQRRLPAPPERVVRDFLGRGGLGWRGLQEPTEQQSSMEAQGNAQRVVTATDLVGGEVIR